MPNEATSYRVHRLACALRALEALHRGRAPGADAPEPEDMCELLGLLAADAAALQAVVRGS